VNRKRRVAIEAAVAQLLKAAFTTPPPPRNAATGKRYRVDDLARAAGTTTRNVRAYQERGLLHPPVRSGRVAVFDDTHLARLKIITSMLERGYTTAHIAEMLKAWESGKDLADILGLERLVRPWTTDEPTTMTAAQVLELAGDRTALRRLAKNDLVELDGSSALVYRPGLLNAFAELRSYGVPMDTMLDLHEQIAPMLDDISRILVDAGAEQVAQLANTNVTDLATMMIRFRSLAMESLTATMAHSIERRIEAMLGDYLAFLAGQPDAEDKTG
jgi:DNA-binding transcriptional MerR regulator